MDRRFDSPPARSQAMRKMTAKMAAVAIWAAASVLPAFSTPARGDEKEDQRRMYEQQKTQQETYIKRLELIPGKKRIGELIAVGIDDGKLVIKSPLFNDDAAAK